MIRSRRISAEPLAHDTTARTRPGQQTKCGTGLSAWESVQSGPSIWPDLRNGLSVSDRESPHFTRVNGPLMARRLDHVEGRPSAFQAWHIPGWRGSCERYALSAVAAGSRWLMPLLSAAGPIPRLRGLPGDVTAPCPAQTPPPNPTAAEPDGRRVLSRGGVADHEVTPQAPLTGSGWREYSYGGFGGGHPHFQPHATLAGNPRIKRWARHG